MEEQKVFNIGDECYIIDNSYAWSITKEKRVYLAGTSTIDPVKVKVASKPFDLEFINCVGNKTTYQFILVEYDNATHCVLNHLTDVFEPAQGN